MKSFGLNTFQESNPSDIIAATMLSVVGADVLLQLLYDRPSALREHRQWEYNFWRTMRLFLVGGLLAAIGHMWYNTLDEFYGTSSTKNIAAKIVLDELVMAPFVITSYIFALGLLEGHKPKKVYREWTEKFTSIYFADLIMWPVVHFVNAFLVPVYLRVVFINICILVWNIFLIHARKSAPFKFKQITKKKVPVEEQNIDLELTSH